MNKIYRVVWNASLGVWVAVSELAKAGKKTKAVKNASENYNSINNESLLSKLFKISMLAVCIGGASQAFAAKKITTVGTGTGLVSHDNGVVYDGNSSLEILYWNNPNVPLFMQSQVAAGSAIAIGDNAKSLSRGSVVIGGNATATIDGATSAVQDGINLGAQVVIGSNAYANGNNNVAIGNKAYTTGNASLAIGREAAATGNYSLSLGTVSSATGVKSTALGHSSVASGSGSVAIGSSEGTTRDWSDTGTTASGLNAVAIGTSADAIGSDTLALGSSAQANESKALAIGSNSIANGVSTVSLGDSSNASNNDSIAIGRNANAATGTGDTNAMAIGADSTAYAYSLALGTGAFADQTSNTQDGGAIAIGNNAKVNSNLGGVAIGNSSNVGAWTTNSIAIGANSNVTADNAIAFGSTAISSGENGIAIGNGAQASAKDTISIGTGNIVTGQGSGAIGDPTTITGSGTYSLGNNNGTIDATESGIFGNNNQIIGEIASVRVVGNENTVEHTNTLVVGNKNTTAGETAVVVGHNSTAGQQSLAFGTGVNASADGAIGIGDTVKATSGHAIAMGHLAEATAEGAMALGWGSDSSGYYSAALGTASNAKGNYATALGASALAEQEFTTAVGSGSYAKGSGSVALGAASQAEGVISTAIGPGASATLDKSIALGAGSNTGSDATSEINVELDKLVFGDFSGQASEPGMQVSIGSVGAERQIKNVAAGKISANSTDAINGSQLFATNDVIENLALSTQNVIGGNAELDPNGTITMTNIGNTGKDTVHDAILASQEEVEQGKNISVTSDVGADGQTIYTVATADEVEFDKVTVGTAVLDAATNDLTGLANTTLDAADFAKAGRAATEEQLSLASGSVADIIGGGVTNENGAVTGPFTANGNEYNNIAEAIEGEAAAAKTEVEQGKNISVTSDVGADGQTIYTVATADEVEFDKVTVGTAVLDAATNDLTGLANTTLGAADFATVGRAATEEQLSSASGSVADIIGGGVTNENGAVTGPMTVNNNSYTTIAEAIEGEAAAAKTEVEQGKNISVTSDVGADGQTIYTVATADEVEFDKVTVGTAVLDAATNDLTGLANTTLGAADFATVGRAATEEQLSSASGSVADIIGGGVTNENGAVTGPMTVNNNSYTTIAEAIEGEAAAAKTEVEQGKNISVTSDVGADGQTIYTVATADEVEFDKVTVGTAVLDAATNDLTGLANTTLGAADFAKAGRAATEEQLSLASGSVADIIGGGVTNENGAVTGPMTVNNNSYTTIAEAIEGEAAAAKTEVEQGKNISVTSDVGADGQTIYTVATADEVEFDKVTVGTAVLDAATNDLTGLANTTLGAADFATVGRAATEEQLSSASGSVADIIGGGVTNENGAVTGPMTVNNNSYTTIAEAIEGEAAAAKTEVEQGKNISVTSDVGADGQTIYTVATADEVEFDKVTVGTAVLDAATNDLTGLANTTLGAADFATVGRAATEEQLSSASGSVADIIGGGVTNENGAVTGPMTVNNNSYTTIAEAIEGEAAAAKTEVEQGKNISVTSDVGADGQTIYTVATADEVEFDKVTVGTAVLDAATNDLTGLANTTLGAADFATVGRAATEEQLSSASGSVADIIGGGVTNENGAVTGPMTVNNNSYTTIAEAIEGEAAAAKTEVEQGKNISVTSDVGADGQTIYTVATADEVEFDKVTVGTAVLDAATNDLTGLANTTLGAADFATVGRAATEEQLSSASGSVADIIGGGVTNENGAVTGPMTVNNNSYTTIAEAIEGEAAAAKTEVEQGKNISVTSDVGADGQTIYTVATADEVEFDKVTVGTAVLDAATNDLTGLANTTLGAADFATVGRAATEEQLSSASGSVADIIGGGVTNENGAVTGPMTVNNNSYTTIAEAIEGEAAAAKTEVEQGKNISVTSDVGADGQTIYTVATADEVEFDKVTVGTAVLDAATNDLTGLANTTLGAADFATVGRAATEEQLSSASGSVADIIGGGVTNENGAVTGPMTVNNNSYTTIAEAIEGEAAAAKTEVEQGKNISVTSDVGADGQTIYTVATADEVEFDKVTVGTAVLDAATNDLTGLANTTLGAADFATVGRAATEEQLSSASGSVADIIGGGVTNENGAVTGPMTVNNNSYTTIAEAIEGEAAAAKTEVEQGKNISVTSDVGADGQTIYTVATADEVEFDKVTVGTAVLDAATNDLTGLANTTLGAADFATVGRAATEEQLSSASGSVADIIGGGVTNENGAVTGPMTVNNNSYTTIAEAIEGEAAAAKTEVEQGKNISVTSDVGADGQTIYTVATADEVEFDKVTVGTAVLDAATNDLTGLANTTLGAADFATVGRAATEEQLSSASGSVADIIGGGVTNENGAVTGPMTVNNNSYTTIAEAIEGEAAAAKTEVEQGKNISVTSDVGADGQTIYTVATADEVEFDKVTVGTAVLDAATNDLTGLANTTLGAADFATVGRAATEEQLSSASGSVADIIGGGVTNENGAVTGPMTVNNNSYTTIAEAIEGEAAAAKTEVEQGKNISVTSDVGADGQTIYTVATADEVEFDKVTVGTAVLDAATNDLTGLANTTLGAADFATVGRAATEEQLSSASGSVADIIGGGVTNENGAVTGPMTVNNNSYTTIAEAIEGEAAAAKTEVEQGKNISVTSDVGADGQTIYTVATADEVEFDKVTVGTAVLDAATNDLTGLANTTLGAADFATVGRAATEEQLSSASGSVADIIGGGVTNENGAVTGPMTVNNNSYTTIAEAIEGEAAAAKTEVEQGKNISVTSDVGADGQTIYTVATADEVEFDKVTVGTAVLDAATNDLTGLANTTLGAADFATVGRAATEEQLSSASGSVADIIGGGVTNENGAVTGPMTVNNNSYTTIAEAIEGEAAAAKTEVEQGKNISVTSDVGADGQTIYTVATADEVEFDKVTVGTAVLDAATNDLTGLANTTLGAADFATVGRAATEEQLSSASGSVADIIGGGVTNENGAVTGPMTVNNNSYTTIAEAIEGEAAAAKTEVEAGKNITVTPTTGDDGQTIYTVATADEVDFTKVTVGDTTITTDGLTIAGGPSITTAGINAGGKKVTDVADGEISEDSTDAVNGSQLYALGDNITNIFGGNAEYVNNQITWTNIGGTGKDNIDDAIKHVNDQAANANQGWNVVTDSGTTAQSTVKPGNTVSITGDAASGVTVTNTGNDITVGLGNQVTVGSGSNAVSIDGDAGTIKVGDVHIDGTTGNITAGKVTVNGEAGTVNGLTNTTWDPENITSGQAATEDQLKQVAQNAAQAAAAAKTEVEAGKNITVTPPTGDDGQTIYTVATADEVDFTKVTVGDTTITTDGLTIAGGPSITTAGINAGGNKVTNVADGVISSTSKDAINGSQLHASNTNIYNYLGGGANYDTNTGPTYNVGGGSHNNVGDALDALDDRDTQLDNKITNLGDQLQQAFYTTNQRIDDVEKRANAGIAAAMALETAPYVAGKWTYAAAAAHHAGENAVGVTFRKTADNGRWSLTSGIAAASQGDPSFRIGISGVID